MLANLVPCAIGEEETLMFRKCGETEGSPTGTSMYDVYTEESHNMEVEDGTVNEDDREEIDADDEDEGTREGSNSSCSSEFRQGSPHSMHQYSNRCCQLCDWAKQNEMEDEATFGEFSTSLDSTGEGRSKGDPNALPLSPQNDQDSLSRQTTTMETPAAIHSPLPEDDVVVHVTEEEFKSFEN